jgi:hypothetical protein
MEAIIIPIAADTITIANGNSGVTYVPIITEPVCSSRLSYTDLVSVCAGDGVNSFSLVPDE